MIVIKTGSHKADELLAGGIRSGMITEIFGASGSGKTQVCFSLCVNFLKDRQTEEVIFVDTQGTFRPERISQIAQGKNDVLKRISVYRPLSVKSQLDIFNMIKKSQSKLIIFDSLTYLFSNEEQGYRRHLLLRNHLHELALLAIKSDKAVVVTNMMRNIISDISASLSTQVHENEYKNYQTSHSNKFKQQEFMKTSVSIYSHIKLKLEGINQEKTLFNLSVIQPRNPRHVLFTITNDGIYDIS